MKTQENLHDQIQRTGSQKRKLPLLLALAIMIAASSAQATIIVNAQQVGGNVVFTFSGSVNVLSLGVLLDPNHLTSGNSFLDVNSDSSDHFGIGFEPSGAHFDQYSLNVDATRPHFLTHVQTLSPISVTGSYLYFYDVFDPGPPATGTIAVPTGYTGGTFSGSMTFGSATFASLGLTSGNFDWSWSNGANSDNLILNVPDNVPDTGSTLALLGLSLGGVLVGARRWKPATA